MDARKVFVAKSTAVLVLFFATLIALTIALATPAPENGGSPPDMVLEDTNPDKHAGNAKKEKNKENNHVELTSRTKKPALDSPDEYINKIRAIQDFDGSPNWNESASGHYRYAAVSTDAPICSTIATDILGRLQGSAMDGAIAAALCIGVMNSHSSGIGGGHFSTISHVPRNGMGQSRELSTIISREMAPLAAHRDMFVNTTDASTFGGLAVAVPGEVMGLYTGWQHYGRVAWSELVQPTIDLLTEGYPVTASLAGAAAEYEEVIRADPNLSELYINDEGELIEEGDILTDEKLAATMTTIAQDPMSFYTGQLAQDIVADLQEYDAIITLEDLQQYQSRVKDPLTVHLSNGDYTVVGPAPPASGAVIEYIVNTLDGYNLTPDDIRDDEVRSLTYHRIVEAFKFAYARRSDLGDEEFVDVEELVANMTSDVFAEETRAKITDDTTQPTEYYDPSFDVEETPGTIHLTVKSAEGDVVGLSSTINLFFGSKCRGRRTGIIFNNEMDDFSTPGTNNSFGVPASPSNYIEPGKMPMSSMTPTLVLDKDGRVVLTTGGSGGTRISTATAWVAMHYLWFGRDILNATDTARLHHQLLPDEVMYEEHLSQDILDGLTSRNHILDEGVIAVIQSIVDECTEEQCGGSCIGRECITAVSDGRKGGVPDGY